MWFDGRKNGTLMPAAFPGMILAARRDLQKVRKKEAPKQRSFTAGQTREGSSHVDSILNFNLSFKAVTRVGACAKI